MSRKDDTDTGTDTEKNCVTFLHLNSLIEKGSVKAVKEFIENKNINIDTYKKCHQVSRRNGLSNPVCVAAEAGHVDVMDYLISVGFDPEEGHRPSDWRPIHYACENGHLDVLKSLVEKHGVDVDVTNSHYDTPLFLAVDNGNLEMVQFLVESEASVNYCEAMHFTTALHKAVDGQPEICQSLISGGADVNADDKSGYTPLHTAAYCGNAEIAELLLDAGADVNCTTEMSGTPFNLGVGEGSLDLLELLYSRGADPEFQNDEDNTPLHLAVRRGICDIVRYLAVEIGVTLDTKNCYNDTPFGCAMKEGRIREAQLLISAGYDPGREECIYDDLDNMLTGDEGEEFIQYARQIAINPRTLQDLCCFRIRRFLGRDISSLIDSVPLPQQLKDFVMLSHV